MMTFDHGDGQLEFEGATLTLDHLKNRKITIQIDDVCLSFEKLLKKKNAIFINNNLSFHKRISFSRDESLFLLTSPNAMLS